jgi:hypothetical protein
MHLRSIRTLIVFAAGALAGFAQTSTSTTHSRSFPPVGLATTETLQVNLLNTATASSTGTAASCTGSVSFANAAGTAIGTAAAFTVASGQVVSISLPFSRSGATARAEIVASVTSTSSSAPCELVTSLEIFDTTTGATHVHIGGPGGGYGRGGGFGR